VYRNHDIFGLHKRGVFRSVSLAYDERWRSLDEICSILGSGNDYRRFYMIGRRLIGLIDLTYDVEEVIKSDTILTNHHSDDVREIVNPDSILTNHHLIDLDVAGPGCFIHVITSISVVNTLYPGMGRPSPVVTTPGGNYIS